MNVNNRNAQDNLFLLDPRALQPLEQRGLGNRNRKNQEILDCLPELRDMPPAMRDEIWAAQNTLAGQIRLMNDLNNVIEDDISLPGASSLAENVSQGRSGSPNSPATASQTSLGYDASHERNQSP